MPASTTAAAPARASGATARRVPLQRCDAFIDVHAAQRRMPGAFVDGAAGNAQTTSAASAQQPSLTAALVNLVAYIFAPPTKRKRDDESEDDIEACNPKRRRVKSNALPPSRAAGRPTEGGLIPPKSTGATASTHQNLTAAAASSAARNALKTPANPVSTGKDAAVRQISSMPKSRAHGRAPRAIPKFSPTLIDINFGNDATQAPSIASVQSGSASATTSGAGKATPTTPGSVPAPTAARHVPSTPRRVFAAVPSGLPETPKPKRVRDVGKRKARPSAGPKSGEENEGDASPA